MREDDLHRVRELPLFEAMEPERFDTMLEAAYLQSFPESVELIREGEPADFLHVVVEGAVELFARSNGRETSMAIVRPVGTFILAAVLRDAVHLMSGRTYERSRVLLIPAASVRDAFEADAAFARAIVHELSGCYRAVVRSHKDIKLRTGVERLANRLLRYQQYQGSAEPFDLPYRKRTLASVLSMTPENLSRAFNTLKPYGVALDGQRVTLSDIDGLTVLAKPNPLIDDGDA